MTPLSHFFPSVLLVQSHFLPSKCRFCQVRPALGANQLSERVCCVSREAAGVLSYSSIQTRRAVNFGRWWRAFVTVRGFSRSFGVLVQSEQDCVRSPRGNRWLLLLPLNDRYEWLQTGVSDGTQQIPDRNTPVAIWEGQQDIADGVLWSGWPLFLTVYTS